MHIPIESCPSIHFPSLLITDLENIELQIITLIRRPKNRVVAGLGPVFHLAQPFMDISRGFPDGLCEQLRVHEMGTGAGGQVAAVLYQLYAAKIDFAVSLYCVLDGIPGLCKCRGIQDYHIKLIIN